MLRWFGWNVYYWSSGIKQYDVVYAAVDLCVIGLLFTMLPAVITLFAGWVLAFAGWVLAGFRRAH
jgi:hypothetical protein